MVERFNRTLLGMLATHCKDNPWDWEKHLQNFCFAYNSSVHASTGYPPFYLMHGRQLVLPIDIQYGIVQPHQSTSLTEYAAKLDQQISSTFKLARKTSEVHHDKQKLHYNKKAHGDAYAVGDLV